MRYIVSVGMSKVVNIIEELVDSMDDPTVCDEESDEPSIWYDVEVHEVLLRIRDRRVTRRLDRSDFDGLEAVLRELAQVTISSGQPLTATTNGGQARLVLGYVDALRSFYED